MEPLGFSGCSRRDFVRAGLYGAAWLTPLGTILAREAEKSRAPAHSVIVLWMQGGPSQLETFDPHPGSKTGGSTLSIRTAAKGVEIASGFGNLAEHMGDIALIRSMSSKEGDHERGSYTMKTGFRPDPTVLHPSIGAIVCHEMAPAGVDIPRHVSILPGQWPARGGYLGDRFDAFRMDDPAGPVPDTQSFLPKDRDDSRLQSLDVVEKAFARGRERRVEATGHRSTVTEARKMMSSDQLKAFDVSKEPVAVRKKYGDSPFGRGCLAARRLIEVGVRCVEVTLDGWDSHVNNNEICTNRLKVLDPAFAALMGDLKERKLLDRTLVLWAGEFGRTPTINPGGGRDHWPVGFSVAMAGGGVRGGMVVGATDPDGKEKPTDPVNVGDLHATVLSAFNIDHTKINQTPIGRTVKFAEGRAIPGILANS